MMLTNNLFVLAALIPSIMGQTDRSMCIAPTNTDQCPMMMNMLPEGFE